MKCTLNGALDGHIVSASDGSRLLNSQPVDDMADLKISHHWASGSMLVCMPSVQQQLHVPFQGRCYLTVENRTSEVNNHSRCRNRSNVT